MVTIRSDSLEGRILKILLSTYPITLEEISKILGERESEIRMVINELIKRGWVTSEPLEGATFLRLLRGNFVFVGEKRSQRRRVKHRSGIRNKRNKENTPVKGERKKENKNGKEEDFSYM